MANYEIGRVKNPDSGFSYAIKSEGLDVKASLDPLTGSAEVEFIQASNMAAALEAVIETMVDEVVRFRTDPNMILRIDIRAGKFEPALTEIADQFHLQGPQRAGEFGTENQYDRFRLEIPLRDIQSAIS